MGIDCGKRINANVRMGSALDMPVDKMDLVREIAIQLVLQCRCTRRGGAAHTAGFKQIP
ncbi:hypothetical protein LP414_01510 [Polaromonas sp. P1(28)-13]|nr:hypothetical protein LP414_01510 [Polaromonas sp. P1(28)-13]